LASKIPKILSNYLEIRLSCLTEMPYFTGQKKRKKNPLLFFLGCPWKLERRCSREMLKVFLAFICILHANESAISTLCPSATLTALLCLALS